MEARINAYLGMEWTEDSILNDCLQWCDYNKDDNGGFEDSIFADEQLAAIMGDDFLNNDAIVSTESDTSSPTSFDPIEFMTFSCDIPNIDHQDIDKSVNGKNDGNKSHANNNKSCCKNSEDQKHKQTRNKGRPKKKRRPNQVQEHIIAERKRRELLAQRFIALSAIVPGLRKTDKTSVLGEAIKYMQQLQEKAKALEEVAAKYTVEPAVTIKKSRVVIDADGIDSSASVDDGDNGKNANNNNNDDDDDNARNLFPQIEVKVSNKKLLFRIYCEKRKGILPVLFDELEKRNTSIVNTNIIPFEAMAFDVTILAEMDIGFDNNIEEIIKSLHSALRFQGTQ